MVLANPPDVVLFCGDLVESRDPDMDLEFGLRLLKKIPAAHHLWVAGNNDIEFLFGRVPILDYPKALQELAVRYDVHLLDHEPITIGDIAFVGNFGYYDLSLWKTPKVHDPCYPSTRNSLLRDADKFHRKTLGISVMDLFNFCQQRLRQHIRQVAGKQMVAATHTVPSSEMLLYDHSPKFDFQNAAMGWDDEKSSHSIHQTPGLLFQFCGHTHRSKQIERPGTAPLINVSGQNQPLEFDL